MPTKKISSLYVIMNVHSDNIMYIRSSLLILFSYTSIVYFSMSKKKKLSIVNPSPTSPYVPCHHQIHTGICDTPSYETYQQVLYHQHSRCQHYIINIINNRGKI